MSFLSWLRTWISRSRPRTAPLRRPVVEELERRELLSASRLFDFGRPESPVQPGYTQVLLAPYTEALGHGWAALGDLWAKEQGGADALTRDVHYARQGGTATFLVDLPDGSYDVTPVLGDPVRAVDAVSVSIEGQQVASGVATRARQFARDTYRTVVTDGRLEVRIADEGGASRYWAIAGLEVVQVGVERPDVTIDDVTLTEGGGTVHATFTVRLSAPGLHTVTVDFATADGSARGAYGDFQAASGTLTFAPGVTAQTVTVAVGGDARPEPDEDFFVNLSNAVNATVVDGAGRGLVLDDDRTATTTIIDADWLAARGPGPYLLDGAGFTYVLDTDVRTEGTAFVVVAAGVTLDLNGHTVTYGDSAPLFVANGGFEEGTGRTVPGWDLGAAPAAAIAANTSLLFGDRVLRLSSFGTAQRIVSDPIAIPTAGRTYAATVTPANPNARSTVTLSVVDAVTGAVLGSGTSSSAARGFSAVAHFTPATTNPVRLRVDVTPPAGVVDSLDLDQATLTVSGDYGVLASRAFSGDVLGYANLPAAARNAYKNAANVTVRHGAIAQGAGDGYASSPLFFRSLPGFTVEDVETYATGTDTESLEATYASVRATVRGSTFREDIDNVSNRMLNFATLKLNNISAPIVVEGNRLLGSPQVGVMLARNDPQFTVTIRGNEFRPDAVVTNGYAILLSAAQNFEIAGNTIVADNGKGINLDGYTSTLLAHGVVAGNLVDVRERPNREYPVGLEAVALRLRNNVDSMGPHRDVSVRGNTFIARTGPGLVEQAYAVRVSYVNKDGAMDGANIALVDNVIKAVVTTADAGYRAKALVLDRMDAGIGMRIVGNVLESNDVSLALTDTGGDVVGVDLVSNTLRKSAEGPARPYTGILAGYYTRAIHDVRIFDTRLEGGATSDIVWAGTGLKDLAVGWLLTVTVRDGAGNPLAGAAVRVLDRDGAEVYSGTTDAGGSVRDVPVVTVVYRQTTADPRGISTDRRGPHRVRATYNGLTVEEEVDLTASRELTLTIG